MPDKQTLLDLINIFSIEKKKELKQHCRSITIFQEDFAGLIWASMGGALPWEHRAHHRDFIPEHLHLKDDDCNCSQRRWQNETARPKNDE